VLPVAEATQSQVERILQNKNLKLSEVQRRLLTYLVEKTLAGEADDLKEYTIGLEAFGKPPSYDPRQESVVRMHVARLRQKLNDYYRTEGAADPFILDLPKGSFHVTCNARPEPVAQRPAEVIPLTHPTRPNWLHNKIVMAAVAAAAVVLAVAGYLAVRQIGAARSAQEAAAGWAPELQQLWGPLLAPGRPLVVCIATPTFGTASGAFRLGQFLGPRKPDLQVTQGGQLSMPDIAMGNIVFLGPPTGVRQVQALPVGQQIVLEPNGIRNLNPKNGEPDFLADPPVRQSMGVAEMHALVSHTPGLNGQGEVLYLSGNQVASVMGAVEAFTDPAVARTLVAKMKAPGGTFPRYYQVVLKVKSMDDVPVEVSYMFHRELENAEPKP
jgi:hypothetical protein